MTTSTKTSPPKQSTKRKQPPPEDPKAEPVVEVLPPEDDTPEEIVTEERERLEHERGLIARYQTEKPDKWQQVMKNRLEMLEQGRKACIAMTVPEDWTLFRGPDGDVVGVPRKSGCVRLRKIMGITPHNYRPKNSAGDASPLIEYEDVEIVVEGKKTKSKLTIVTMLADGYCHYTGETIEDVRHSLRSDESFTGRGTPQDLIQSCRTGLDNKITRILSDTVKVPEDVLKGHGIDTSRCYKGHGFGSSKDREGKKAAEPGIAEKAKELGIEIMKRTGGDKEAARDLLVDITKREHEDPKKSFAGFKSVDRITQQWQLDKAWERLRAHEVFGDENSEAKQ